MSCRACVYVCLLCVCPQTRLVDGGVPRQEFVRFPMSVATFEMERITLDHVSTMHSAADTESARAYSCRIVVQLLPSSWTSRGVCVHTHSAVRRQLGNASTAAESLSSRVAILVDYLQRVKSGEVSFPSFHTV